MRNFGAGFAAHIASGATTLCWCFKLARRDGVAMGFTDHDVALAFGGMTYAPAHGLEAGEAARGLGQQTRTSEVLGVLASEAINEDDIALGRYDGAQVESWRVNWRQTGQRELIRVDTIGEITREDGVFHAELRSAQHGLNVPRGRLYQHMCDARLGDGRCQADVERPQMRALAVVTEIIDPRTLAVTGLSGFAQGWFAHDTVRWTEGRRSGITETLASHAGDRLSFAQPVGGWVSTGDRLTVYAGCDKRFATCREKFGNGVNFQGFPHIPGNDFLMRYPSAADRLDGMRTVR